MEENENIVISKKAITRVSFIILVLIIIILMFLLLKKDNNVASTATGNVVSNAVSEQQENIISTDEQQQQQTAPQVETNKEYSYEEDGLLANIEFKTDNTFQMSMAELNTSAFYYIGTYTVNQNIVTITITQEGDMDFYDVQPYTKNITILDDGRLEYKIEDTTIIFDKNK